LEREKYEESKSKFMNFLETDMRVNFKSMSSEKERNRRLLELVEIIRDKRLEQIENL
jgi:hypothetical protein